MQDFLHCRKGDQPHTQKDTEMPCNHLPDENRNVISYLVVAEKWVA
jgi:hypothetical protein